MFDRLNFKKIAINGNVYCKFFIFERLQCASLDIVD